MLTIRLHRVGKRHQPVFRVVLAEKHKAPGKKFLEILGTYNPRNKEFKIQDPERVKYWLKQNVEVSPTVNNLLVEHKITEGQTKVQAWKPKKKDSASEPAPAEAKSESNQVPELKSETDTDKENKTEEVKPEAVVVTDEVVPEEAKA